MISDGCRCIGPIFSQRVAPSERPTIGLSRRMSRSNSANTANMPAKARPLGVAAYKRAGPEATGVAVLGGLGQAHVDGLETLGPFLKIELDRLTLFE